MTNFAVLVLSFVAGVALRRSSSFADSAPAALNGYVLTISLPALILHLVPSFEFELELLLVLLMPWLLFVLAAALLIPLARRGLLERDVAGALLLTAGLGNTSFVGVPMIGALYREELMVLGLLADVFGSLLCLSLLGLPIGARLAATEGVALREGLRRVLRFPPFGATILALALRPVAVPEALDGALAVIGATLAPVALFSVGLQLRLAALRGLAGPLALGLAFKLVLGPLLVLAIYAGALGWRGEEFQVTIFLAAMGPMVSGGIVAQQLGLRRELVTLMLGLGIPLSFLTLPAWRMLLELV